MSFLFCSRILLKKICHDYDQKHRLLMIENEQIRQCLVDVHQKLNHLLLIHRTPSENLAAAGQTDDNFEAGFLKFFPFFSIFFSSLNFFFRTQRVTIGGRP